MFTLSQTSGGQAVVKATGDSVSGNNANLLIEFAPGFDIEVGRGTADTDRTYIALRNSTGVKYYLYVDTTAVIASTTKP